MPRKQNADEGDGDIALRTIELLKDKTVIKAFKEEMFQTSSIFWQKIHTSSLTGCGPGFPCPSVQRSEEFQSDGARVTGKKLAECGEHGSGDAERYNQARRQQVATCK